MPAPLPIYAVEWRLITGILDVCAFFPGIVLAGLVVPFGIRVEHIKSFPRFSTYFFSYIKTTVIAAVCAAAVYGALLFLVRPLSQNYKESLIFNGRLFHQSKETAQREADEGKWIDAEKSILICRRIWAKSEEIRVLSEQIHMKAIEMRLTNAVDESRRLYHIKESYDSAGGRRMERREIKLREPMNAAESIDLARKALGERRFYDARWLASVGARLAIKNSPEYRQAVSLEAEAWKATSTMGPSFQESEAFAFYREKRDGYTAMEDEDWLKAYRIFYRLAMQNPGDPDSANFLALSKEKVAVAAFSLDGKESALGEIMTNAFYSLPIENIRIVIRIGYLTILPDAAYGRDVEIDAIDHENRILSHAKSPYCKVFPQEYGGILLMLRAIENGEQFDPIIIGIEAELLENAQIRLGVDYEDFVLLSKIQRGLDSFFIGELFRAQEKFADYGYITQVFQADIIYRIFGTAIFLPIAVLGVVFGWRFRAKKKPCLIVIPMLFILPFVFNVFVLICQELINKAGVLSVVGIGFINSLIAFTAGTAVCFFSTLAGLAAQRER
jgi:hypothetical protein